MPLLPSIHGQEHRPGGPDPAYAPGEWVDAVLISPWTDVTDKRHVQYRVALKDTYPGWNIEVRGSATGGTVGSNIFQLPAELWPDVDEPLGGRAKADLSAAASFWVLTTGYVQLAAVFPP